MAQLKNPSLTVKIIDADASPSRSPSTPVPRTPKVVGRLDNKWRELEREWNSKNGEQLGRLDINGKDGLLGRWKRRYDPESSQQSSQHMLATLDKILNGVELVGAFAAQGVSMVFAPAGMCFNAVGFLLDIPKQIKEVYDALQDLFEEVNQFLIRFKIYKRLDDKVGLPDELVDSTTDLLITFIKICGVAGRLLRGGFRNRVRLGFKVLLRDDEMKGHLEAFRILVDHSMMLNGTVMLEEVMNNSEATKQILSVTSEMNAEVKLLVARSNNEKTKQVNKDRLSRICRKLFERPPGDEILIALPQEDMLPDTLDTLQATTEHQQWLEDLATPRSVLVLWGPPGCGKSRMLEAVRAHLEILRDEAGKDQANTYTAFFDFNDTRFKAARGLKGKGAASFISDALRIMAYQVASQSTTYTTDLVVATDSKAAKISKETDIEALWSLLGLSRLSTSATSTLYVLLDGMEEQGAEGQKLLRALLNSEASQAPGSLRIKILMTWTSNPESDPENLVRITNHIATQHDD
ncbi:hypothetical protein H2200_012486 [Cladophialophora chaetospira]|uniref:Fungal STAND N-terminal Goodbye domain-containing protein n=1 Tax=Cladophialophora chaetospira TaxID=386627 RepID=A0AA38WXX1_9EURO|nr:hypothetical protein H2200_012486 [Cladophialophora chaetospira]